MSLHAVSDVEDAIDVTRSFLTPIDVRRWLKLALIVFFVGSGTGFPTGFNFNVPAQESPPGEVPFEVPSQMPEDVLLIAGAVVIAAVLLAVAFFLVSAIMEFVFVESLRSGEVTIRRHWRRRWKQGLRLFGFRILLGLPVLAMGLGFLAIVLGPLVTGASSPVVPIAGFLLAIPLFFAVAVFVGLVYQFTSVFVVPIMIKEECGVLAGWKRLWGSIKANWKQYLVYALVSFGLSLVTGLLVAVVLGIAALLLLLPLSLLGLLVLSATALSSPVMIGTFVFLVLVFALAMLVLTAVVQVPIQSYLRYYALLVLGDVEERFDLIPDRRARVRAE
jgi:hypothetical protein